MTWTQSAHCHSRAHCFECRNNRAFRESIAKSGMASEIDFSCPLGIPIGSSSVPRPASGPGSILKRMLARLGIAAGPMCKCNARAAEMDAKGPEWCQQHIDTIAGWLREEAIRRGIPSHALLFRGLIRIAIARSRREAKLP